MSDNLKARTWLGFFLLAIVMGLLLFVPAGTVQYWQAWVPDEIDAVPRSWAERAYPNLIYYNKVPKGGHFAAWEQPKLFVEELRAGFRSLR